MYLGYFSNNQDAQANIWTVWLVVQASTQFINVKLRTSRKFIAGKTDTDVRTRTADNVHAGILLRRNLRSTESRDLMG